MTIRPWSLGVAIAMTILAAFAVSVGSMPRPDVVTELVNHPEVVHEFRDPAHGRFDAMVFLFTCVIIAPLAFLALVLAASVAHMALEATVLPVARQLGMSDRASIAAIALLAAMVAYQRADLWWPSSVKLMALLTRAWVISAT